MKSMSGLNQVVQDAQQIGTINNPDWAVLVELDGKPRLYFVVESKGSLFSEALRVSENSKIQCGREHFKALNNDVDFMVANNFSTFSEKVSANE